MFDKPKTLQEAKAHRYAEWAGSPKGTAFDPSRCAYEMYDNFIGRQCSRKPGHGPDGLYCKQHAKRIV
jgi:hypothetical protein